MASSSASSSADGMKEFDFACPCLNVQVHGKVSSSVTIPEDVESTKGASSSRILLSDASEIVRREPYVTWYDEDSRPSGRRRSPGPMDGEGQGSWRTCWICETRCYRLKSPKKKDEKDDEPGQEIYIDLQSGIMWGKILDELLESSSRLPFSSLRLDVHPYISTFGKPPPSPLRVYKPADRTTPAQDGHLPYRYIKGPQDPFFLPPPFIPSHPHLRDLCTQALEYLKEQHAQKERQIVQYIERQEQEMRDLEDTVRNEVEALWTRFAQIPGVSQDLERSRSRSKTRGPEGESKKDSPAKYNATDGAQTSQPSQNPLDEISDSPTSPPVIGGSSLLSASRSTQNYPQRTAQPPKVADYLDDSIMELTNSNNKASEELSVAMSHVFSVLDDSMADRAAQQKAAAALEKRQRMQDPSKMTEPVSEEELQKGHDHAVGSSGGPGALGVNKEDGDGATPRPSQRKELGDTTDMAKEKKAVKFEVPTKLGGTHTPSAEDQDEYVFDFDLEDPPKLPDQEPPVKSNSNLIVPNARVQAQDLLESNLAVIYASNAPSHRKDWQMRLRESLNDTNSKRKTHRHLDDDEQVDESSISKLAMSMPMGIATRQPAKPTALPPMERKTSYSDRNELVPPLIAAMRQRGIGQNALGLSPTREARSEMPRKISRTASTSKERDREMVRSYAQDPGAVFESLADHVEDDDDEEEQEGTFVPPHVMAKRRESQDPDVGWRSLAPS